ncbi:ankyrin repeat-containing domain protein [Truncatella angustata]|uniref:Ankyrin repeat-containing domain protein n=1 Tax=Truncatella angustata TaxID=152316 RepID=A0A9P8UD61_9PEZI|nr:ankyrin repeat-containing domain protein [Truncatella angustata]KAH6646822.1 ankyrin repeat-containing domain protein [Truncatella angustata]
MGLLKRGAQISQNTGHALHLAAAANCLKVMAYLVRKKGVCIDATDTAGYTALHYALCSSTATTDTIACLFMLGADINRTIFYGIQQHSPLDIACEYQRWTMASELIRLGADVNGAIPCTPSFSSSSLLDFPKQTLQTALMDIKTDVNREHVIKDLLRKADLNAIVVLGSSQIVHWTGSLLHWLLLHDKIRDMELLLRYGQIDIEIPDSKGKTCLAHALSLSQWQPEAIRLLMRYGANVPARTTREIIAVLEDLRKSRNIGEAVQVIEKHPYVLQVSRCLFNGWKCLVGPHDAVTTRFMRRFEELAYV